MGQLDRHPASRQLDRNSVCGTGGAEDETTFLLYIKVI
jgi:hypothetical protein